MTEAEGEELEALATTFVREGVIPRESAALFGLMSSREVEQRAQAIDALVGGRELRPEGLVHLERFSAAEPDLRAAIAAILVAPPIPAEGSTTMIRTAALDETLPAELRAAALGALGRIANEEARALIVATHAEIASELPADPALLQAWRRFVSDRRRVAELEAYARLAGEEDEGERVLGYAVLVQIAGTARNPEAARTGAAATIAAAWSDITAAAGLVRAITLLGVEERYADRLAAYRAGTR
jgi:hypothetical protein